MLDRSVLINLGPHSHQVRELSRRLAALGYGVVAWNETVSGREGVRQLERAAKKKRAGGGAGGALWLATQVRPSPLASAVIRRPGLSLTAVHTPDLI